jgi:tRNA pseudouridine38-40 synthase
LNGLLSRDIRVLAVKPVALDFHAQRSASKKQYSYYFQQGPSKLPHLEPYSWWIRKALDREAIQKALNVLIGEHDFKPFQASGAKPGPTVRRILEAEALVEPVRIPGGWDAGEESFSYLRIRLIGSGFLKQMVRGIAGTLLQIGEGRRPWQDMEKILETRDRTLVGPTAPARALWLERVWYDTLSW